MSTNKALLEKIRRRREAMRETQMDTTEELDETVEPPKKGKKKKKTTIMDETLGASMVDSYNELTGSDLSADEMADEIIDATNLAEDLKVKHKERQRALAKSLRSKQGDVQAELRNAKKQSKQKLEASLRRTQPPEGEEEGADSVDADDGGVAMPDDAAEPTPAAPVDEEKVQAEQATAPEKEAVSETRRRDSKSLASSIRDRLRSKVQSTREKAESEARDEVKPERKLRGLREKQLTTRFDDATLDERAAVLSKKWKESMKKATDEITVDKAKEQSGVISAEESLDFFTRNWDPEMEEEEKRAAEEREKEEDEKVKVGTSKEEQPTEEGEEGKEEDKEAEGEPESEEAAEKKKTKKDKKPKAEDEEPLLADDLEDEGWDMYVAVRKAEYIPYEEKRKHEDLVYFVPSMIPVPSEKKIPEDCEPRFLEEEGLFVGERPIVSLRNQNKLEDRLLHEPDGLGKKWFGEDGQVMILPNPLKEIPNRPPISEEVDPFIETIYCKAQLKEFDSRYIDGRIDMLSKYQLDVDINSISFSHHHLFGRENVLAVRLTQLYDEHLQRTKKNLVSYLTERLRALKVASSNLQESIRSQKVQGRPAQHIADQESRLRDYKNDIKQTRQQRDNEEENDRLVIKGILRTWKEIKSLRQLQRCTNTAVKLSIRREETNRKEDQYNWNQELEEELQELKDEQTEEYNRLTVQYNITMAQYQQQQQQKKEAEARKRRRERKGSQDELNEEDEEQAKSDDDILDAEDLPRPEPPTKFDERLGREQIKEKILNIRRRPGEPIIHPELSESATITPKHQCPRGEQQRRDAIEKCKIWVKVIFNNKAVCHSKAKTLNQEFKVSFAQIINILIVQWPESVRLEIYEDRGFTTDLLAEMYLIIPESTVTSENVQLEDLDFSCDHKVEHTHEGVGSGVLFDLDTNKMVSLMTTGEISCSLCWAIDSDGTTMIPTSLTANSNTAYSSMKNRDAVSAIGAAGMVDLEKLSKWIAESRLDPNDPSNADLVYLMKPMGGSDGIGLDGKLKMPDYFRLEQLQEEFNFCTDDDLSKNLRFRLLEYRDQEIQEFRSYKPIPIVEREIPTDIFVEFEKKKKEAERVKSVRELRDVESHRQQVTRYMQQVREQVLQRFRALAHQKHFSDMIVEDEVPDIATLIPKLIKLGVQRRPLRPIRKTRKKVTAQVLQGVDVKILVNVIRAFDVPVRDQETGGGETTRGARRARTAEDLVRPYVEVMFQSETYATCVADGPNPSWNEELEIDFRPPDNDFSPANLQTIRDVLYFNLFDEVVTDMSEEDIQRQTNVHRRIEKKWLGSLKVPFSTLYLNSTIEGTFKVDMPPVLLGYSHDTKNTRVDTGMGAGFEVNMSKTEQNATYITLFITIEPQLSPPEPIKEKFDTNEDEKLLDAAEHWQSELEKKFVKRQFKTMVIDMNGRAVFISRYFRSIKPPEELLSKHTSPQATAELVARYVSLIPFVSDSVAFAGIVDIWSTCDQFMKMLAGDEEEHAVLLTNYFLFLGKKAYLLIGSGIPEGNTAYVLTEEEDDFFIWNASSGEHFSYRDNYCPLHSVGCLINHENIWANIQENDQPARISFNLTNGKEWKTFFTKTFRNPGLSSVQPDTLDYYPTEQKYVLDLQDKLEKKLKEKIMEWRPRSVTRWNRHCMLAFRQILSQLEENRGKALKDQNMSELDQILGSYKMSGFPINLPFTDVEPIIDSVYSTGVHENQAKDVEFAVAVHIIPYPNSVMSVWVYIASLIRKR
ncbi:coiled-coil and C2 domain-containing protein 2A-like isoform X2 [Tubulanus polymorphus]|uniref:coiled-coil and C2 domain-containing protein 2A-like isoform X2 n=1 Tax=Tubulanus polymorphus TaxID=672921 RepID=UPI003DA1EFB4